jgi:hypothetical protein
VSVTSKPTPPRSEPSLTRRIVVWALLFVGGATLAWLLTTRGPTLFSANDFVQYWGASRLNRTSGNPYDPAQMLPLQRSVGWDEELPLMMWNPPWTLPLVALFGLLPYQAASTLWVIVLVAAVALSAILSWDVYDGPRCRHPLALLPVLLFVPTLAALELGQISVLILVGVVGFLYAAKREKWHLAGIVAVLISIKPQLLYLFWPLFVLWCVQERRWPPLVTCGGTALVLLALSLAQNPLVLTQYLHVSIHEPPLGYMPSTLGTWLRLAFGWDRRWLQFVPAGLGLLWALWYWGRHRRAWAWRDQMPVLLLVSVATTAYGWAFDLVVLVPVLVQVMTWALRHRRVAIVGAALFLAINAGALLMTASGQSHWYHYTWMPWAMLGGHLLLSAIVKRSPPSADERRSDVHLRS